MWRVFLTNLPWTSTTAIGQWEQCVSDQRLPEPGRRRRRAATRVGSHTSEPPLSHRGASPEARPATTIKGGRRTCLCAANAAYYRSLGPPDTNKWSKEAPSLHSAPPGTTFGSWVCSGRAGQSAPWSGRVRLEGAPTHLYLPTRRIGGVCKRLVPRPTDRFLGRFVVVINNQMAEFWPEYEARVHKNPCRDP